MWQAITNKNYQNYKLNMEINKELRFRIYYGYSPSDYLCIKESELERAKYAWQTGSGFSSGTKTVSGSEFKRIEEDFRYYTGWYDTYNPKEKEDMLQIKRDMPDKNLFEKRLGLADNRVKYILRSGKTELLQSPEKVDTLLLN